MWQQKSPAVQNHCLNCSIFKGWDVAQLVARLPATRGKSSDWNRGPTELVHHSAYRRSSHRLNGATSHLSDWFFHITRLSNGEKGVFYNLRLPAFAGWGGGRGIQHPVSKSRVKISARPPAERDCTDGAKAVTINGEVLSIMVHFKIRNLKNKR